VATLRAALARLDVGGDKCDGCGAAPPEEKKLRHCGRCRLAYYCSPECSKVAWKTGHKQACRAPSQFEIGDMVQIQGLVSRPTLLSSLGLSPTLFP
jgi:hypothetical protein